MTLGLLLLASVGKENIYFNIDPNITFFKTVFKKYVNTSYEILPQYFRSSPNFGRRLSAKIAKNSDLIKDITLYFELPDIPLSNHSTLPSGIKKFAWANKIALAMIRYIDVEIGGVLFSRHYGDWLNIEYETQHSDDTGWEQNIGANVKILIDYSNGKPSYKLYIPLSFFFNMNVDVGLPIGAITKQDIEIHVELNDFSQCYKESPTNYFQIDNYIALYQKNELIIQNVDGIKSAGEFIYFDINTKRVYYNKLYGDFLVPATINSKYNIIGQTSGFYTLPSINSIIVTDENYFPYETPALKDAYILVNYIYLEAEERWYFLNNELEYVVPLVSTVLEKDIKSLNSNYILKLTNPHKALFWRAQLDSNLNINDVFNYTSLPLTTLPEPLIQNNKLLINSIARNEIYNSEYYNYLQTYINKVYSNDGIYMFSFGFNPMEYKPQGTMNFSMVDDSTLVLGLNKIVNYNNSINVRAYGLYYNVLVIKNGNCSFKYYL
jgi:hypothetical protein